jgi:hypothetical protein
MSLPCWAQRFLDLQKRIPKADPKKYLSIGDASQWENPILIVHRDGIEMGGTNAVGPTISADSVLTTLQSLPISAWPYGLVVAVQQNGIVSPEEENDHRQRKERERLVELLKKNRIAVRLYPSA